MSPLPRFFRAFLSVITWPARVAEHRRCIAELAGLDDHALRDIGLTRQDLRDATAAPLGSDPTAQFAERAREREAAARVLRTPPPPPRSRRAQPEAWRPAAE
jgi:uncharacterized protein YjiS (DUF1127 family)